MGSDSDTAWRAEALSRIGYAGLVQVDFTTHKVRGDGDVGHVFGIRPDRMLEGVSLDELDPAYFEADLELMREARTWKWPGDRDVRYEFRLRDPDRASFRWIRTLAHETVDRDGRLLQASGVLLNTMLHPPENSGIYTSGGPVLPNAAPRSVRVDHLDHLSGQLIGATRSARAMGLHAVEADLRRVLGSVAALLGSRVRARSSH